MLCRKVPVPKKLPRPHHVVLVARRGDVLLRPRGRARPASSPGGTTTRRSAARSSSTCPTRCTGAFYVVVGVDAHRRARGSLSLRMQQLRARAARRPAHDEANVRSGSRTSAPASGCRRCCATPPPGIMHSFIYFGFVVPVHRHGDPRDRPPAAGHVEVPARPDVSGVRRRRRRRRRRVPRRHRVGDRPPLHAAALPHPHQDEARGRRHPRHVPGHRRSPASSPRRSGSRSRAGPTSRSGRSSATRSRRSSTRGRPETLATRTAGCGACTSSRSSRSS